MHTVILFDIEPESRAISLFVNYGFLRIFMRI